MSANSERRPERVNGAIMSASEDYTNIHSDIASAADIESNETVRILDASTSSTSTAPEEEEPKKPRFIMEPAVFFVCFAGGLCSTVHQNQWLYQACTAVFNYSREDCEPLLGIVAETNTSKQIEDIIQPYVAKMMMANTLIGSIIPVVISLFLGPWSDKYGRRAIMLISYTASFISFMISCIMTAIALEHDFNPWFYLLASIPTSFTGGFCALTIVTNCYITDVAPPKLKGLCFVLNDAALGMGYFMGNLAGAYIFKATNMATVNAVAAGFIVLAFLYVLFFVKESIPPVDVSLRMKVREFFRLDLFLDLIRTCFLRPANYERTFLWCIMVSMLLTTFATEGGQSIFYLFARKQFNVSVTEFTTYRSISTVIAIFGGIVGMVILRKAFKISTNAVALLSLASFVLGATVLAAATKFWELYLASGFSLFCGIAGPMMLTMLSHLASSAEIGKIYSVIIAANTLLPLGATPLYTTVYNATLTFYPGLFNIISVVLYLIAFTLIAIVYGIRRANKYELS